MWDVLHAHTFGSVCFGVLCCVACDDDDVCCFERTACVSETPSSTAPPPPPPPSLAFGRNAQHHDTIRDILSSSIGKTKTRCVLCCVCVRRTCVGVSLIHNQMHMWTRECNFTIMNDNNNKYHAVVFFFFSNETR